MKLSPAMKRVLLGLLGDFVHGTKRSTGTDGLAVRLGSSQPNRYAAVTTWALRRRGLLQVDCSQPGNPIWRITEAGIQAAFALEEA